MEIIQCLLRDFLKIYSGKLIKQVANIKDSENEPF